MKQKFSLLLAVLISLTFFTAFTPVTTQQHSLQNQTKAMISGTWYISSFGTEDADMTDLYSDWQFGFNSRGGVVANRGEESVQGTYTSTKNTMYLDFYENEYLAKLNGSWYIKERNEEMMHLLNDHGYHIYFTRVQYIEMK